MFDSLICRGDAVSVSALLQLTVEPVNQLNQLVVSAVTLDFVLEFRFRAFRQTLSGVAFGDAISLVSGFGGVAGSAGFQLGQDSQGMIEAASAQFQVKYTHFFGCCFAAASSPWAAVWSHQGWHAV